MSGKSRNSRLPKRFQHNGQNNTNKSSSEDKRAAPPQTAWNNRDKTTGELFPDAELVQTPMEENEEELNRTIQASLKAYEAQKQSGTHSRERNVVDTEENFADDDYWSNKAHRNLPSPERERAKKAPDTNNNSATKKTIDTTVVDRPLGSSAMARRSGTVQENINKFEEAAASMDKLSLTALEKPPVVDMFGRINGQNECHMFMGSGGRKKEAAYIEEQIKKGLLWVNDKSAKSHKVTSDNELNRTKYNKSSRNMANDDNEARKSLKSVGPETRFQSIERASNVDHKPANNERVSSQRNVKIQEASSVVENKSPVRSKADRRTEKSPADQIPTMEPSKNETIRESQDDSSKKVESKVLRISDFNSRHNKLKAIEEDNSSPSSLYRDTQKPNDHEGACSQMRIETSDSSLEAYDPPPGFQSHNQREIPIASDAVLQPEVLYDRLALYDPSLYRLLMQKKVSELQLQSSSSQSATNSLQAVQENFIDYDDYPETIDNPCDNAIDTFATHEQRAANFQQQLSMNYGHASHSPQHMLAPEFSPGIYHTDIPNNFRPDSVSNYANCQCPLGYMTYMNGNMVQVIVPSPTGPFPPGPSNFHPTASAHQFPLDYERFPLMRNQGPLNVHQGPNMTMNPQSQQQIYYRQRNHPHPLDNQGRKFDPRSFNSGHAGNVNNYPGNRQAGKNPQAMQFPRESRGRGRM